MNRANFGNVVTNGMQILSVGATTASKVFNVLGRADKTLKNTQFNEQNTAREQKQQEDINYLKMYNEEREAHNRDLELIKTATQRAYENVMDKKIGGNKDANV